MKIPHSEDAERGVLGSILLDSHRVMDVCIGAGVHADMFYSPKNRTAFWAMTSMRAEGKDIDLLTFADWLQSKGLLEDLGGRKWSDGLVEATPTAAHCEHYIAIVVERYRQRAIIEIGDVASARARDGDHPGPILADVVASCSNLLDFEHGKKENVREEHVKRRNASKAGGYSGLPVKWPSLADILNSYTEPNNVIVAAKSSIGKTVFVANELMNMAAKGIPVGIISTDMTKLQLQERMAGDLGDVNFFKFGRSDWTEADALAIDNGWDMLERLPIYICDNPFMGIGDVLAWMAMAKSKWGVRIVAIDFLQQLSLSGREHSRDYRLVVGEWSKQIKAAGKKLGMVTMVVSQLSRYGDKYGDTTPPRPNKEALKESGDLENNADVIILLCHEPGKPTDLFTWREEFWNIDLIVGKHRNGPCGVIPMALHTTRCRLVERHVGDLLRRNREVIRPAYME
jgi:replicative DNA helicase